MYMCVQVCISVHTISAYVCAYVVCVCMCMFIACVYVHVYAYECVCMYYVCMYVCVCVYIHVLTYTPASPGTRIGAILSPCLVPFL